MLLAWINPFGMVPPLMLVYVEKSYRSSVTFSKMEGLDTFKPRPNLMSNTCSFDVGSSGPYRREACKFGISNES